MDSELDWSDYSSFELIFTEKVMRSEHYWGRQPLRQESDAGRAVCQSRQAINFEASAFV